MQRGGKGGRKQRVEISNTKTGAIREVGKKRRVWIRQATNPG